MVIDAQSCIDYEQLILKLILSVLREIGRPSVVKFAVWLVVEELLGVPSDMIPVIRGADLS